MSYTIRPIEAKDNAAVERVIRTCLIEFGANHEGTAWADPDLGRFSEIYNTPGNRYWVAEDETGNVVGGTGIGKLTDTVCELQKMYCLPQARGTGLGGQLMAVALDYARQIYEQCYLEALDNMTAARRFYAKHGFIPAAQPPVETAHFACEVRLIKTL